MPLLFCRQLLIFQGARHSSGVRSFSYNVKAFYEGGPGPEDMETWVTNSFILDGPYDSTQKDFVVLSWDLAITSKIVRNLQPGNGPAKVRKLQLVN
jgi:hypothetical protein